ncbi:MAG: hypothetical protein IJB94_00905, partial [Clostridia bacterium]|nr:hypothetical protein [Clostridia bacterium]
RGFCLLEAYKKLQILEAETKCGTNNVAEEHPRRPLPSVGEKRFCFCLFVKALFGGGAGEHFFS